MTFLALGALAWFVAVFLIRFLLSVGALEGSAAILTYAAVLAGTWPLVALAPRVAGLQRREALAGAAIMSAAAALIDGVVTHWFGPVYAGDPANLSRAASVLLWGLGAALILGLIETQRARSGLRA